MWGISGFVRLPVIGLPGEPRPARLGIYRILFADGLRSAETKKSKHRLALGIELYAAFLPQSNQIVFKTHPSRLECPNIRK